MHHAAYTGFLETIKLIFSVSPEENIQQFNKEELHLYLVDKLGMEVGGDTLDTFHL